MHTWMDLVAIAMVCFTAVMCAAMLAPQRPDKDDNKKD